MGDTRSDLPGTAPVPVTGEGPSRSGIGQRGLAAHGTAGQEPSERGEVLAHFHAQSYGKDVAQVETLFFGTELSNGLARPIPGQVRPLLPALRPLRDLNAAVPVLDGPWSKAQRLLAACVEAVRVRRVSAADRYPVHRAYPSPRGLFGADLFLLPGEGSDWCLRVDPQSHALQPQKGCDVPEELETALSGARVVLAVDRRRYPPEYGRLRPSLALLEGGHLLATLGLTLTRAGLRPLTHVGPSHTACADAAPLLPEGMEPSAALTVGTEAGTHEGGAWGEKSGTVVLSAEATAQVADSVSRTGRTLREWLDERTSGVSTANLVTSSYVSPEEGSRVTSGLVTALSAVRDALPEPDVLRLYRHVLENDRVDARAVCELRTDGTEGPSRRVPRTGETNFSATLGHTLAVDFPAWVRAHDSDGRGDSARGDGGPVHDSEAILHTLLGWTAQWGCLGAAATDLCARPMRNYSEEDWAAVLGLGPDQTPAYQLWVRTERGTYMDIPVDAENPEVP